jgi:predicted secreted protein
MATPMLAKQLFVSLDSSIVAYATDYSLKADGNMIEVTSFASGAFKEFLPGIKEWSIDCNGLVTLTSGDTSRGSDYLVNKFLTLPDASLLVSLSPTSDISANHYLQGVAYLKSFSQTGKVGGDVTFSASFQGTGVLTQK